MNYINFSQILNSKKRLIVILPNDLLTRHKAISMLVPFADEFSQMCFITDSFAHSFYSQQLAIDNLSFEETPVNINFMPNEDTILVLEADKFEKSLPDSSLIFGLSRKANFEIKQNSFEIEALISDLKKILKIEASAQKLNFFHKKMEAQEQVVIDIPGFTNFFKMKNVMKYLKQNFSPKIVLTEESIRLANPSFDELISVRDLSKLTQRVLSSKMTISSDKNLLIFLDELDLPNLVFYGREKFSDKIELFKNI